MPANSQTTIGAIMSVTLCALAAATGAGAQTGSFTMEASPSEVFGEAAAVYVDMGADIDAPIIWNVYAPPASTNEPPGLLVYVSPAPVGPPPPEWIGVLDAHNLLWISPRASGNQTGPVQRMLNAWTGMAALERERALDTDRYYVAGLSGGGGIASIMMPASPAMFDGAIYFSGAAPFEDVSPETLAALQTKRYVFVTGRDDFNRRLTRDVFSSYQQAGVENALLLDLRYLGHELPRATDFARAIDYLDGLVEAGD